MKTFALIGAAGYIAPRHLQAIRESGNELVAAMDPHDSVGVLDRFFPQADFFTNEAAFWDHLRMLKEMGRPVDYLVVCSPNDLHEEHIRNAFACACDVICEKPVTLHADALIRLAEAERQSGRKVYTIMQLRLHPTLAALKKKVSLDTTGRYYTVRLKYITPRGKWYHHSWKGDPSRSGGLLVNIGVHMFDLLQWIFGPAISSENLTQSDLTATGTLNLEQARVSWQLSIDRSLLQETGSGAVAHASRLLEVDGTAVDFSDLGNDLHLYAYEEILAGRGYGLEVAGESLQLVERIRASAAG